MAQKSKEQYDAFVARMKERVAGDGDIDPVFVNEKRPTLKNKAGLLTA